MPREMFTEGGYKFDEVASALQKCIRRGLEEDAVFWAQELESRFYKYVWKRLLTIAHEDVGPASPETVMFVETCRQHYFWFLQEKTFSVLPLVNAVVALCRAPKSRDACDLLYLAYYDNEHKPEMPDWALDRHTARGRQMGRGWDHFEQEGCRLVDAATGEVLPPGPYQERARALWDGRKVRPWVLKRDKDARAGKFAGKSAKYEMEQGTLF
jgi:replication-associated recombination protein RarA